MTWGSSQAVNEMIYLLSQPRFLGKIIVILAGYTCDIDDLIASHPNLAGFFPEDIVFEHINAQDSLKILQQELAEQKVMTTYLTNPQAQESIRIMKWFSLCRLFPSWGNARDIKTLGQQMARAAYAHHVASHKHVGVEGENSRGTLSPPHNLADDCMRKMFEHHRSRNPDHVGKKASQHWANRVPEPQMIYKSQDTCPLPLGSSKVTTDEQLDGGENARICLDVNVDKGRRNTEDEGQEEDNVSGEESMAQTLGRLGPCPAGYAWHANETGGWTCDGGSHSMTSAEAARLQLENAK